MCLLNLLNEKEINEFVKYRNYEPNQVVFDEGGKCLGLGIIAEGEILVKTFTFQDKEETISTIGEGGLFGQFILFNQEPYYIGIGITTRKTKVAFINKNDLETLFAQNTKFLEAYLEVVCSESVSSRQQAKLLAHKNIRDRIMYYFKLMQKNGEVTITSVTDLANKLSIPRPSVSRELTNMENENLITRCGKTITIKKI